MGVTPMTLWIAFSVHLSSATICWLVSAVMVGWDQAILELKSHVISTWCWVCFVGIMSKTEYNALTVNSNLVACVVSSLQGCGVTDSTGAHNEEGSLCLVLSQDAVQARRVGRRTIYEYIRELRLVR